MRALCGAIITAGAMVGLGLTALGYGIRFQGTMVAVNPETGHLYGIPTLAVILIVLLLTVIIGMGIAFLGLMFHHQRRHFEMHREGRVGRAETMGSAM